MLLQNNKNYHILHIKMKLLRTNKDATKPWYVQSSVTTGRQSHKAQFIWPSSRKVSSSIAPFVFMIWDIGRKWHLINGPNEEMVSKLTNASLLVKLGRMINVFCMWKRSLYGVVCDWILMFLDSLVTYFNFAFIEKHL